LKDLHVKCLVILLLGLVTLFLTCKHNLVSDNLGVNAQN